MLTRSHCSRAVEVFPQSLRTRRVAQLGQRLRLDLAYSLARDLELPSHLFERVRLAVLEPESQPHDLALAHGQLLERARDLELEALVLRLGRRLGRGRVGHEVAERAVVLLADGRLERERLLRDALDLTHLVGRHVDLAGDLLDGRLAAELLE